MSRWRDVHAALAYYWDKTQEIQQEMARADALVKQLKLRNRDFSKIMIFLLTVFLNNPKMWARGADVSRATESN